MYLEISGRRTGKTTRLVEAARKAVEEGYSVAVISRALHILRDEYRDIPFYRTPNVPEFPVVDKIFVDECDCLDMDFDWYEKRKDKLYVCGTPSVKGISKQLAELQPNYESITISKILAEKWKDSMSKDTWKKEFLASFK